MVNISERSERPIENSSEDSLGRGKFVRRLSASLVTSNGKSTGIVIGLIGSWGSGKSSILNLLREQLQLDHTEILIVNFDPWLVSGRDDLITQFLAQMIAAIQEEPRLQIKLKGIAKALASYGSHLSPIANLVTPGLGAIISGGFTTVEKALSGRKDIGQMRKALEEQLRAVGVPIVVVIDELDRVEDQEVRAVAQLVRAVADFRSISYVLAFDPERVTEALGGHGERNERMERGKAYLEKIVQLQIPVPIAFEEEIGSLLSASLVPILKEHNFSDEAIESDRYQEILEVLTGGIITTPRDIKRLVGTFHAIFGMVVGEVDWIDVLVYCVLLVKAPRSIDLLRKNYQVVVQGQISEASAIRRLALDEGQRNTRLEYLVPDTSDERLIQLLSLTFPFASDKPRQPFEHQDAICTRRPLLTILRLALPPKTNPRNEVEALLRLPSMELADALRKQYAEGHFDDFFDRMSSLYFDRADLDELGFWTGVSIFLQKPDNSWLERYNPMFAICSSFAELFERKFETSPPFREHAESIIRHFIQINEKELMPAWLRTHLFAHRLFGNRGGTTEKFLLPAQETQDAIEVLCQQWRKEHFAGELLQSRWSLQTVYSMIDAEAWDAECKELLVSWMSEDAVVDGICLFLFGSYYSTGYETVEAFCGVDFLLRRANERLSSSDNLDPSLRVALKKAVGDRSKG